jgi:AraC-like DNA-binding protein
MAKATLEQVAGVLNLSPRRVQQLAKEEGMPRVSRGEYELVKCVHWYIAFLTRRMEEARRGSSETESQARARYIAAIADLKQMDVLERKGEVIRNETVLMVIDPVLQAIRSIILSMPRRLAALVAPSSVEGRIQIESIVDSYVRDMLDQISNIPVKVEDLGAEKRRTWSGAPIGPVKESATKRTGKNVGNLEVE